MTMRFAKKPKLQSPVTVMKRAGRILNGLNRTEMIKKCDRQTVTNWLNYMSQTQTLKRAEAMCNQRKSPKL